MKWPCGLFLTQPSVGSHFIALVFLWSPRSYPAGPWQQGGPSFHTYPSQGSTAHWDPEKSTRMDHIRRKWTLVTFRCWCFERFRSKRVSHKKYLYSTLCYANSNLHLWVSGANFLQLGPSFVLYKQNATIWTPTSHTEVCTHSSPKHQIKIRSFRILPDWKLGERQSPHKAVQKNVHQVLEQRFFLKGRQKCAQTGEYLSRNKHDQIMPDSVTYVGAIQFSISWLSLKRAEPQERHLRHRGEWEESVGKTHSWKEAEVLGFL